MSTETRTVLATDNIDEVIANEAVSMAERDFVLDVIPTFVQGYDKDGNAKDGAPKVAVQTLMAIREGKEHAPESNGLPIGNLMLDFLVDEEPVSGKRVAFKAPLFTLVHIADAIYEANAQYLSGVSPRTAEARRAVTDKLGIPARVANMMTDSEILSMTFSRIFGQR